MFILIKHFFCWLVICLLYWRYTGRLFVKGTSNPTEILNKLNEMAGYAPDQEIELYEVCS